MLTEPTQRARSGHPRVGGENNTNNPVSLSKSGPSPRGRGKLRVAGADGDDARAIPAWAGKTRRIREHPPVPPGHPRVGGENTGSVSATSGKCGPSPRGRGKQERRRRFRPARRAIPAWAGKTRCGGLRFRLPAGHPRVGGENIGCEFTVAVGSGPSPRGRGKPEESQPEPSPPRAIPAWAGKTLPQSLSILPHPGHPRVGGENAVLRLCRRLRCGPSPSGRGKLRSGRRRRRGWRAIPAWAGKTVTQSPTQTPTAGHPRVGGENSSADASQCWRNGPSPRGRGKRWSMSRDQQEERAIPAWAGKTWRWWKGRTASPGHPRVGGENALMPAACVILSGPSPRGRGKHACL